MPIQGDVPSQNEIAGNHSSNMETEAPQPINLAALHRLNAILELKDIPLVDGLIAADDIATR